MFSSRTSPIAQLTLVVVLAAAAAGAPSASAGEQRYAGPYGAGNDCSFEKPCDVASAINGAHDGDEVIIEQGNYVVDYPIQNTAPVSIHGVAGQSPPKLYLNSASLMKLTNARLSYAEVIQNSPSYPAVSSSGSTLNQVILRGGQQANCAAGSFSSTLLNSVVVARNPSGDAICVPASGGLNSSNVLNVTAIAQSGDAIYAYVADPAASVQVDAVNVIARAGSTGAGFVANATAGGVATIVVRHSNYMKFYTYGAGAQVFSADGNQSLAPAFVDEATGDYRQKAGSPTIDAGGDDPRLGAFDLDGDPRAVGTPDIGADEYAPPAPAPGPTDPAAPAGGATGSGGTLTAGAAEFAGVGLVSSRLALRRGFVSVKLSCPAATTGRCTGVTKLSARRRRTGADRATTVALGRARFSIASGARASVKVRMTRSGRRLFAHTRRLRGRAASAAHDGAGLSKTTISRVTIRKGIR